MILRGEAEIVEVDESVLDAYDAKYGYRPPSSRLYRLRPAWALAWLEAEYPTTATRFDFTLRE